MAIKPKQILDTALDVGKTAVGAAERRIRGRTSDGPSGAPSTVGASKPGTAGGPKSATAPKRKPKSKAKAKPRKPAKKRAAASRAAATSGTQVKRAAKKA
jgi:hypothetical protein